MYKGILNGHIPVALKKSLNPHEIWETKAEFSILGYYLCHGTLLTNRQLQHENVVKVFGMTCDIDTGEQYFVMEYVDGGNLRDYLQTKGIEVDENFVFLITISLCQAMIYLQV